MFSRKIEAKCQTSKRSFSVWVGNLPGNITEKMLLLALSEVSKVRCISIDIKQASYKEMSCPAIIQELLKRFGPLAGFDAQPPSTWSTSLKRKALARFVNAIDAKIACDYILGHSRIPEMGETRPFANRVFSLKASVTSAVFPLLRNK